MSSWTCATLTCANWTIVTGLGLLRLELRHHYQSFAITTNAATLSAVLNTISINTCTDNLAHPVTDRIAQIRVHVYVTI